MVESLVFEVHITEWSFTNPVYVGGWVIDQQGRFVAGCSCGWVGAETYGFVVMASAAAKRHINESHASTWGVSE